jgi:hypothetical protein
MVVMIFLIQSLGNKLTIMDIRQKGDKSGFGSGYFSRYPGDKSRFYPIAHKEPGFCVFSELKPII